VPADESLVEELVWSMEQGVDVAYARQLATLHDGVLETYTRLFNYPEKSEVRTKADIARLGIKAFFCSNVCAMYRRDRYEELGGFIRKAIFNEDMIFASEVLKSGGSIAYCAEAKVYHSHSYTWTEQFHRNFDLGVSQADNPRAFRAVSSEKEGVRYVTEMLRFLWGQRYYPEMVDFIGESMCKYAGYLLGKHYRWLPEELVLQCTMNQSYWKA
ncbi:MAG: glycosyltransferase family 2 protein, partial [Lachnospiraceae bacterium]